MTSHPDFRTRTACLLGEEAMERLAEASVAVIGLGGVGGACAEALVRAGVGRLILMDHDRVDPTNLNRQLFATQDTVGQVKVEAARSRLLSIHPGLKLCLLQEFYAEETKEHLFSAGPELIVDAIDTVTSKLNLAAECRARGIPLIQSLGTGNRLNPAAFRVGKIEDTVGCGCGLARVMRRELKKRGLTGQTVLYSTEFPRPAIVSSEHGRHSPASISFCPPAAGYIIAGWVVEQLISGAAPAGVPADKPAGSLPSRKAPAR